MKERSQPSDTLGFICFMLILVLPIITWFIQPGWEGWLLLLEAEAVLIVVSHEMLS